MSGKRRVIVHYHIFKNAGTSVDEIVAATEPELHMQGEVREIAF